MGWLIMSTIPYFTLVVSGVVIAFVAIARRPRSWWAWIAIGSLVSQGILINGYPLADEFLAGAVVVALFMAMSVRRVSYRLSTWSGADVTFASLITLFMLASIRSVISFESPAMFRFVMLHGIVGIVYWARRRVARSGPDGPELRRMAVIATSIYGFAYIAHGIAVETFTSATRFDLQGLHWSGSAYAMLPGIVGVFAALMILRYGEAVSYRWALASLIATGLAASFYQSRVALLAFTVMVIGAVAGKAASPGANGRRLAGQRRVVTIGALAFLGVVLVSYGTEGELSFEQLGRVAGAVASPFSRDPGSDTDRWSHIQAAAEAFETNPGVIPVGGGYYSHRLHLAPALHSVLFKSGAAVDTRAIVRTTGFPALLVDLGVLGVALFYLSLGLAVRAASRLARREARPAIVALGLVIGGWLLVSNVLDMILLFVLIMPRGLLVGLVETDEVSHDAGNARRLANHDAPGRRTSGRASTQ